MTSCPSCFEKKKVGLKVSPVSERFPKPIYRYTCGRCQYSWIVDENKEAGVGGRVE